LDEGLLYNYLALMVSICTEKSPPVRVADVFRHLDEENTRVALQGLEIRYLMR
jgi:hypothetical protein